MGSMILGTTEVHNPDIREAAAAEEDLRDLAPRANERAHTDLARSIMNEAHPGFQGDERKTPSPAVESARGGPPSVPAGHRSNRHAREHPGDHRRCQVLRDGPPPPL